MVERRSPPSKLELILLAVVTAEVAIGRVLTRGLEKTPVFVRGEPQQVVPTTWFVALDYLSLFLLYFAALLGVIVLAVRAAELMRGWPGAPPGERLDRGVGVVTTGGLALAAVFAAAVDPGVAEVPLHACLGLVAAHQVVRAWIRRDDVGASLGLTIAAAPILLYCLASLFAVLLWSEDQLASGEAKALLGQWGRGALVIAAIASPYCLAPRPFARSMTRLAPFAVALLVAGVGAVLLRVHYVETVKAANRVLGLALRTDTAQDQIALYLLAFATVTWTVVACLTAPAAARQRIGLGLALLVLAGWAFAWPLAFVVAGAGLVLMGDGATDVHREERAGFTPATPPIDDDTWQRYVGHVVAALRRAPGSDGSVSAVSVRGEGDHTSTVVVAERRGLPVRLRVERVAGAVVVVDVICGREVEASRAATWSVVARAAGVLGGGGHPEPPPAGSQVKLDDPPFDERFRCRGDRAALLRLLDDGLRARAAATLDGWLAYWDARSLRHRVFPGQGAPLDELIPLTTLAHERRATTDGAERLLLVIDLCVDIAAAGISVEDEPATLAAAPVGDAS